MIPVYKKNWQITQLPVSLDKAISVFNPTIKIVANNIALGNLISD